MGRNVAPGRAATASLLAFAGVALLLAPPGQRLENAVFDQLQRLQQHPASPEVVLVDTSSWTDGASNFWNADQYPELLHRLNNAGAQLILPAAPPPLSDRLPDARQLAALADLEQRRTVRTSQPAADTAAQWAEISRRSGLHARTAQAAAELGNVIIALPVSQQVSSGTASSAPCIKPSADWSITADDVVSPHVPAVGTIGQIPADLCHGAIGTGHMLFLPDQDGVVRHLDLVVNAAGTAVGSTLLHAVAPAADTADTAGTQPGEVLQNIARQRQLYLRFSPRGSPGKSLTVVAAEQLLQGTDTAGALADRIVVLGDASAKPGAGYHTPAGQRTPVAMLLATGLSNLLTQDYITRSGWLAPVEVLLLLLVAGITLGVGLRVPAPLAAMTGLLGAGLLLGLQGYLLGLGLWVRLAGPATLALVLSCALPLLPRPASRSSSSPRSAPASSTRARPPPATTPHDLDLAFSVLRQQPTGENVKRRLYELALTHARNQDPARAERVLRHLAGIDPHYRGAGDKLRKLSGMHRPAPAAGPAAVPASHDRGGEAQDFSGRTIGRYRIERVIGRGAMATVYLGLDPKINRQVAIKAIALASEFDDSELENARTQFLREAESAGRLNHPNIIGIYDAGEDGQVAYLAMEYFPGRPLSQFVRPGNLLPPAQVIEIVARIAEALHYAHAQRVVHRDIKPANLLYDLASDTLKITDFGIARLTDSSRTRTGIILGTPSYMAPEQLTGGGVTGQSDLFSLGVTLYQLLSGQPPFRADSIALLMQKIAHDPHPPLSTVRNDLPAGIHAVIDRALAKEPADRFADGRAMALALRDCCSSVAHPAAVRTS